MLKKKNVKKLLAFKREHEHCCGRGYYIYDGPRLAPSESPPNNLSVRYRKDDSYCVVTCKCGVSIAFGDDSPAKPSQMRAIDNVTLDMADYFIRLMDRPKMFLGEMSEIRLGFFLCGAEMAMTAMDEEPRFLAFLNAVGRRWSEEKVSYTQVLPKTPDGLPDMEYYPLYEEQSLANYFEICKRYLRGTFADILIASIVAKDDIAKQYLWF